MRLKWRPRTLLYAVLATLVAGLAGVGFIAGRGSAPVVERDPFFGSNPLQGSARTHVTALGRLEPEGEVLDISGPPGSRVMLLAVREGDKVKAGAVLAELDEHARRLAAKERARARLHEARAVYAAETGDGDAAIEEAGLRLRQTDILMPLEIKAQEAVVKRIDGDLANARRSLDRLRSLQASNRVSNQEVDDRTATVLRLEADHAEATFTYERLKASREIEKLLAIQRPRRAQAALERGQVGAHIESLTADLALAEAELEQVIVHSPIDGVVLKVVTWPGERLADQPILKLGNIDQMFAVAEVYETDIRFVQPGMRATITSPALAGAVSGTVDRVSPLVFKNDVLDTDPAARSDTRVVEVRIKLDDSSAVSPFSNLQVYVSIDLTRPPVAAAAAEK